MTSLDHSQFTLSFIIPVYNRPSEVGELLESLCHQTQKGFEVIIVEDGSTVTCEAIVNDYRDRLDLKYFFKPNSGPGQSRNYGFERTESSYCVFLDSDCVLPPRYFEVVYHELTTRYVDAFGGPDRAEDNYTVFQKAINYSMTSFFTTGGIRGGGEKLDKFHPRSFNMGYSREVFEATKGFSKMRFGEDIDMSLRILGNNFRTRLIKDAYVYHKRRSTFKQFFKQIFNSGIARINLYKRYPSSLKMVHAAPAVFTVGLMALLFFGSVFTTFFLLPILIYLGVIAVDATVRNKSLAVGIVSVLTSLCQLTSYGLGFLTAVWRRLILRKDEFSAFQKTFYD